MDSTVIKAVGISGSPAARSKSRTLLEHALRSLGDRGVSTTLVDLSVLPADALLGRRRASEVDQALALVADSAIVVASTPVYRATYSGLLKVFFDLFPQRALAETIGVAIATGGGAAHQLVLDHGLRPLFSSVGGIVVPTGIYGTDAAFVDGVPDPLLLERVERAAEEAIALTHARQSAAPSY